MLFQELKEIKSGREERHQFGLVIAGAMLLLGAFFAWRGALYPPFFIIAAIFAAPVLIDKLLKTDTAIMLLPLQKIWMAIAVVLGFVMSRVILGILFFGVFTAIRAINRILGKPLLDTDWKRSTTDSYWIPRETAEHDPARSEKQY